MSAYNFSEDLEKQVRAEIEKIVRHHFEGYDDYSEVEDIILDKAIDELTKLALELY